MMKKIICPIDYSTASMSALQYAGHVAAHFEAELTLLHVIRAHTLQDIANVQSGFSTTAEKRETAAKQQLLEQCAHIGDTFGVKCYGHVIRANAEIETVLEKEIEENDFDLIIMGTNGADDLGQFYFGTHTYKVLRNINCPLLCIPEYCTFQEWKRVVYAMNYEKEDLQVMRKIKVLTQGFDPKISVLHISEKDTPLSLDLFTIFKDIMREALEDAHINFYRLTDEDPATAIDFQMKKQKADLLVLLTHNYTFLEKIVLSSVSRKLSLMASYPVLIYHK